mmetsp:Transcript_37983/g.114814  ORF Transcript_37983/g.114814 Transcript_37983/m.114814 type:complete len:217 (+) Transcript_37983:329-979(+)
MYCKPMSSSSSFCTMKVATVFDNSLPVSMMRKHNGMISVCSKKLMTSESSTLTKAPMTPKDVSRRYSKGLSLLTVLRNGYSSNGICALRKRGRVSGCDATHCSNASELHTRLEAVAVRDGGGDNWGYIQTISCISATMVPKECHRIGAKSASVSRRLESSSKACSRRSATRRSMTWPYTSSAPPRAANTAAAAAGARAAGSPAPAMVAAMAGAAGA